MKNPLKPACLISSADKASCAPGSTSGFSVRASSRMVGDFTGRFPVGKLYCASEYSSPYRPSQLPRQLEPGRLDRATSTHHDVKTTMRQDMKAPPFPYIKATTLAELLQLLHEHGDGARLLAGGQSLLAALNLRLS